MIRIFAFCAALAIATLPAMAQPSLMMKLPDRVWRCTPHDQSQGKIATLFFFDQPFTVDRYGRGAEFDRVEDINLVVDVRRANGDATEFTFGRHSQTYTEYRFSMRFSVHPGPDGPTLINYDQPAIEVVIDRVTGEMRYGQEGEEISSAACEAAPDSFATTDAEYLRLLVQGLDAVKTKEE